MLLLIIGTRNVALLIGKYTNKHMYYYAKYFRLLLVLL